MLTVYIPSRGSAERIVSMIRQLDGVNVKLLVTELPELPPLPDNVEVILHATRAEYDIAAKRNYAVQHAIDSGLSYCVQIDDDIHCKGEMKEAVQALVDTLEKYPWLGAVCATSANRFAYASPQPVSHPFVIKGCATMFIALNLSAVRHTTLYTSGISEDHDMSAQLWTLGYPIVSVPQAVYDHVRPRNKQRSQGGFPINEINALTLASKKVLERYPVIKRVNTKTNDNGFVNMITFWNWPLLLEIVAKKGITYKDSKHETP